MYYDKRLKLNHPTFEESYRDGLMSWTLGCVKRAPVARGGQGAGITQPRYHSLADPCKTLQK